ncbi:MAG TPA: hypothetical protein VIS30_00075 [Candidatus Deferrimicrobiaceae bacterium]
MKGTVYRFGAFAGGIVLLVTALKLLNWLPLAAQKDLLKEYRDLEEGRAAAGIETAFVPSYFPQNLSWPPSMIWAQGTPFPALLLEFEKPIGKETALLISQAESESFFPEERIRFLEVRQNVAYTLKGREARLQVGVCPGGETCAGIAWKEGRYHIVVRAKTSPFELIRIAESMLR